MELAAWIAQYYLAPLGEVLRSMLPLMAEVRRSISYRISEIGQSILFEGAQQGSSRAPALPRTNKILSTRSERLSDGQPAKSGTLRTATGATAELLTNMLRKKWLLRETEAAPRDARRLVRFAVLVADARPPKLNENQLAILAELAGAGGSLPIPVLRRLEVPSSTLQTLVKRGLVSIEERPAAFHLSAAAGPQTQHVLNAEQQAALDKITAALDGEKFGACLLHGVTGSGKTAVYLAAMQRARLPARRPFCLVPEIGLTPAMAAQLAPRFGGRWRCCTRRSRPKNAAEQWHRIRRRRGPRSSSARARRFSRRSENLGLIVVDEEHDLVYKQESMPRYHARDVAVMRAKIVPARLSFWVPLPPRSNRGTNARRASTRRSRCKERVNDRPLPQVELVDMRREFQETGQETSLPRADRRDAGGRWIAASRRLFC